MTTDEIKKLVDEAREYQYKNFNAQYTSTGDEMAYEVYACNKLPAFCNAIEVLMKQLEKCKEQRDVYARMADENNGNAEGWVEMDDKELNQIGAQG